MTHSKWPIWPLYAYAVGSTLLNMHFFTTVCRDNPWLAKYTAGLSAKPKRWRDVSRISKLLPATTPIVLNQTSHAEVLAPQTNVSKSKLILAASTTSMVKERVTTTTPNAVTEAPSVFNPANGTKTVFMITPTHKRYTQMADLTRLAQTLMLTDNVYWVVVEDSPERSDNVAHLLQRLSFPWVHLLYSTETNKINPNGTKGVAQRMHGLRWVKERFANISTRSVVYFGDDDNAYDIRLFRYMNLIERAGIWPVAFCGGLTIERPKISEDGQRVVGFHAGWKPNRTFAIDMAGFAISLQVFLDSNSTVMMPVSALESHFLTKLGFTPDTMEPVHWPLREVLVWHVKTVTPQIIYEKNSEAQNSYDGWKYRK